MDNLMKVRRKTRHQIPPTPDAVNVRLRSLSVGEQVYIADKYYQGKMPWQTGGDNK